MGLRAKERLLAVYITSVSLKENLNIHQSKTYTRSFTRSINLLCMYNSGLLFILLLSTLSPSIVTTNYGPSYFPVDNVALFM